MHNTSIDIFAVLPNSYLAMLWPNCPLSACTFPSVTRGLLHLPSMHTTFIDTAACVAQLLPWDADMCICHAYTRIHTYIHIHDDVVKGDVEEHAGRETLLLP